MAERNNKGKRKVLGILPLHEINCGVEDKPEEMFIKNG
jgi:hypothetical protein